jgi:hypothetical protein
MQNYQRIVGNQEDWANFVTNVEMAETPFLDWLPLGNKPTNVLYSYQADKYRDPKENSQVNGQRVSGFKSAGETRDRLRALVHYLSNAAAVPMLNEDVSDVAGMPQGELASEINKGTKELSRDLEAHVLDRYDHREDNQLVGYKTRSVGSWVDTAQQALFEVPAGFRPPAASCSTVATASLTENTILDILESIGKVTKAPRTKTGFVGPKLKRAFNNMPLFIPTGTLVGGTPTGATGVVYSKDLSKREIARIIESYRSDYGQVDLVISQFQTYFQGNQIEKDYTGYFLHQEMWELRWHKKPKWTEKAYEGGAYEAFCEAVPMLVCKNPSGEGKYAPTT